ncbi:hypothetical protein HCC30_28140, partial [Streptomyces sp. HNM0574]|nr:hypothetical protein [Streptomyces sp. HNM0574]
MSKRNQKGRRHRTVNRTPRPVTRRRTQPPGHLSTQAPAQAVSPDATTEPNPTPEPKPTPQRAAVSAAGSAAPAAVGRVTAPAAPEVPAPGR